MKKYRLKKIYPGSPPLETILVKKPNGWYEREHSTSWANTPDKIEPFSEFWEEVKEEVKKEFEILSYDDYFGNIFKLNDTKQLYTNSCLSYGKEYSAEYFKIDSIKRISDGVIFTIGDKVYNPKLKIQQPFIISKFYLDCNKEHLLCDGENTGAGHINITKIEHYKEPLYKVLVTCPIEGDIYSIQRISDNCIFKLKDKVVAEKFVTDRKFTQIDEIYYNEHKQLSYRTNCDVAAPKTFVFGEDTQHYKEVLLVTEDGISLYKGDVCYIVFNDFSICSQIITNNTKVNTLLRYFSNKKSAEKYIDENKPIYSNKDIEEILTKIKVYRVFNKE